MLSPSGKNAGTGSQSGVAKPASADTIRAAGSGDAEEVAIGWKLAGLGFQLASEVGAGALLGWLVDRWLNSAPTGLLIGSIAGIAVGLWSLIRGAFKLNRQLDEISKARRASGPQQQPKWRAWEDEPGESDDTFDDARVAHDDEE